jgi:hypothetical protein
MSFLNSPEMKALESALKLGRGWGNILYDQEMASKPRETSKERAIRLKKASENMEELLKKANVEKKKSKFVNSRTGTLKKIAKKCKWECKGEKCWAHDGKACPYIHKGEPGWNEKTAVTKKGGKRNQRHSTRKTRR